MKIIAHIQSDFTSKFGIPRQSGIAKSVKSRIIFEKEYSIPEAFRELEGFSHIWIIWQFSQAVREKWSPTVRPPMLGGNKRVGVFATRSPFRPNNIGLSAVKLEKIEHDPESGTVLIVSGADLMDGTPIYDIKPYLPYSDSIPEATGGFAHKVFREKLDVIFPPELSEKLPEEKISPLTEILADDPRPAYIDDDLREYGFVFGGFEIGFKVNGNKVTVTKIQPV